MEGVCSGVYELFDLLSPIRDSDRVMVVLDVIKAYDNVRYQKLMEILPRLNLGEEHMRAVFELIEQWKNMDMSIGKFTCKRNRGIPQGAPMATDLFDLYEACFVEDCKGLNLRVSWTYADNWIWVGRKMEILKLIERMAKTMRDYNLDFNIKDRKVFELKEVFETKPENVLEIPTNSEEKLKDTELINKNYYYFNLENGFQTDELRLLGYRFKYKNGRFSHDLNWIFGNVVSAYAPGPLPPFLGISLYKSLFWGKLRFYLEQLSADWNPPDEKTLRELNLRIKENLMRFTFVYNYSFENQVALQVHPVQIYIRLCKRYGKAPKKYLESDFTFENYCSKLSKEKHGPLFGKPPEWFLDRKPLIKYLTFWVMELGKIPEGNEPLLDNWIRVAKTVSAVRMSARKWFYRVTKNEPMTYSNTFLPKQNYKDKEWKDLLHNLRIMDMIYLWIKTEDSTIIDQVLDDKLERKYFE